MDESTLQETMSKMVVAGKGILAADESIKTAGKRLASINVESTEETRRQYRNLILTAPTIGDFIVGVILFEETLGQKTNQGLLFPEHLQQQGVVPGIKVDQGLVDFETGNGEQYTQGLEGLGSRLEEYKKQGARFAKWRAVYKISESTPTPKLVEKNAQDLATYAKICQEKGIVPIVEPEVLIDGMHSIDKCEEVTLNVQQALFKSLEEHQVDLRYTILKPSMVISGKDGENRAGVGEVAQRTINVLKQTVPEQLPSINFLSGGQSAQEATAHLNEMNKLGKHPWYVSFSYARALQGPALQAWSGKDENVQAAQSAFINRARLNGLATKGEYSESME